MICFYRGHKNVGKENCRFCNHCGTVCLKIISAVKTERVFFQDKPKRISEVEGRSVWEVCFGGMFRMFYIQWWLLPPLGC